jgi:hypothetical protein
VHKELTIAELDSQSVELLPDRETLLFDNNWAAVFASNSSLAVNAATVLSAATSSATQTIVVAQG